MSPVPDRRRLLKHAALAGLAGLAGCVSAADPGDSTGGTDDAPASTRTATSTATDTPTEAAATAPLDEWLADANGYEGEIRRQAPRSSPTVMVGEHTDDGLAFAPPAIEVAPGTNVRWDWTGDGAPHNVVALDGTFDSGRTNAQHGTQYHYVFTEPGVHRYVSEPDREDGMRGVVVVAEPPSSGNEKLDEWVVASGTFDGTIADRTGADTATVSVGVEGNGGTFAFGPPALRVDVGTTVEWEWVEESGPHNVVFEDVDAGSAEVFADPGVHVDHTFEESGTYLYACEPHESLGMRGAVVVE
ncbi:halocyanin domain-containing protein [Halobaculum lipolyticum]|uniref:Halocyanin domain-containing protein n=1 Tax=Halobaculum lipolyticum TaxID=3032001 RepID=A0ABD5WB30_9EURY|nr:halocyanin domain-containing protein [Halobaculum sp. DT31]